MHPIGLVMTIRQICIIYRNPSKKLEPHATLKSLGYLGHTLWSVSAVDVYFNYETGKPHTTLNRDFFTHNPNK